MDFNYEIYDNFADLCQQVFDNHLILSKIFKHLSLKELFNGSLVCHKWQNESKRVIRSRSESLAICHLFRTEGQTCGQLSTNDDINGGRTDEELDFCSRVHWIDKYDFRANVITSLVNGLQAIPDVCLVFYGSYSEDVTLTQRLYQMEMIRKSLPGADCRLLNLNSQCLIGYPTTSSVPIQKISHFGDLAAVSVLLLPTYRTDVNITVFTGTDVREKVFPLPKIKAMLVFTTSSIFQDNRTLFDDLNTISRFITTSLKDSIAFGGYNSAYFSFNRNDFINYLATDANEAPLEPQQLIGLCFSGENVSAGSLVVNTKRANKTESKLREFKKSLGFEAINNDFYETFGFIFCDEERVDSFLKLDLFRSVFPDCPVIGVTGYGQYGFNYWPKKAQTASAAQRPSRLSFNRRQLRAKRMKRIINLNSNMTTFVVIRLKKRFY